MVKWLSFAFMMVLMLGACAANAKPLRVVTSISPIHALVKAVTKGVAEPVLLLGKSASLHHYHLKPTDVHQLSNADILFYVDPALETFLRGFVGADTRSTRQVRLSQARGLLLMPYGASIEAPHEEHDHEHGHDDDHDHDDAHEHAHHHSGIDYHLWLSPSNAAAMVEMITQVMTEEDPENALVYRRNKKAYLDKLVDLDHYTSKLLAPYRSSGFMVTHDSLGLFSAHYRLNYQGGLSIHPESYPGARHLHAIYEAIKNKETLCLFTEPHSSAELIKQIIDHTHVHTAAIDVEWAEAASKRPDTYRDDAYLHMMERLARTMADCFTASRQP
jgi:zinc transport system substrate-binding protein